MRFTALTDLHIHNYKKFDRGGTRLNHCLNVIIDVFEYNHKNNITYTFFSGDLFDSEKLLPTSVVNRTIEMFMDMFKKYPTQRWLCISGNHDYATKNIPESPAETALKHLSIIFPTHFILIDNSMYSCHYQFLASGIPYYEYKEHFIEKLKENNELVQDEYHETYSDGDHSESPPIILMIHQTPENSNPNIPFDISADDKLFEIYDLVLCGHIHKREKLSYKFWLVGSPIHKSLEDEGQKKGFMVFDTENLSEPEFIHLDKYPEFRRSKDIDEETKDYIIPIIEIEETDSDIDETKFEASLKHQDLVTNYWDEVDGKDKELLKTGLNFLDK